MLLSQSVFLYFPQIYDIGETIYSLNLPRNATCKEGIYTKRNEFDLFNQVDTKCVLLGCHKSFHFLLSSFRKDYKK